MHISSAGSEPLIVVVGFLGAGKTSLLHRLVSYFLHGYWTPYLILNDYENAYIDANLFSKTLHSDYIKPLAGSCICCSGVDDLKQKINNISPRKMGITFVEANGTTDACRLMEVLSLGIHERFKPPIQIAVVDTRYWQKRGTHNFLELNQVQVSSMVVLNHTQHNQTKRNEDVLEEISKINPNALITSWEQINIDLIPHLKTSINSPSYIDHSKSHWSSCSVELPRELSLKKLKSVLRKVPQEILRLKGIAKIEGCKGFCHFERTSNGETILRSVTGDPKLQTMLVMIGPGSQPSLVENLLAEEFPQEKNSR